MILTGCNANPAPVQPTRDVFQPQNVLMAIATFEVIVPATTGGPAILSLIDEVTGLELNPTRYRMDDQGGGLYSFQLPLPVGSVVKYRYTRESGAPGVEYTPAGKPVRYRLLQVTGPVAVRDIVAGWEAAALPDERLGRLTGQVVDAHTNAPVPNIMIAAGGVQTLSATDGTYSIEGLPEGVHNLVAYSLDGAYQPYQQGAQVAAGMTTPTPLRLMPAPLVSVTFTTRAPADSARGIPIRLIGNTLALGNTFANLAGGTSTLAARAPLMTIQPDGRYTLTLSLPAGLDLRYKYSAGDGFWNAEHTTDGSFQVRQLIVPNQNVTIEDTIASWQVKGLAPITFTATISANTPTNDTVSIQFNPYRWTEPIPMWPLGNRQWFFVLYSPLQLLPNQTPVGYRFCRNDQCGVADDESTAGANASGKTFTPGTAAQNLQDEVKKWVGVPAQNQSTTVVAADVQARGAGFYAGVELAPRYRPAWQPYLAGGFEHIHQMGANWVVLTPTWSAAHTLTRDQIEPVPGQDPCWQDLIQMVVWAQDKNLSVALFPSLNYLPSPDEWWNAARPDGTWWLTWFDHYRSFILQHADLAAQVNAGLLILSDPTVTPAAPNGRLPAEIAQKWPGLIAEVRAHYSGKIAWALPFSDKTALTLPAFANELDAYYLLWAQALTQSPEAQTPELATALGKLLDDKVFPFREKSGKPLILGISYPSASGAARGCALINGQCLALAGLTDEQFAQAEPDLAGQTALYNAVMITVNQRTWIDGVIARGFYPPAVMQDASASIHGKPSADVLWYWYPRLLAGGQ